MKHARPQRGALGIVMAAGLAACSADGVSPETAELTNAKRSNLVPKSSPAQLVAAFDTFCVKGNGTDKTLRAAGYVPLPARNGRRAYVVDDRRPAVAVSNKMCIVKAKSRTGQTDRFRAYVADTFPGAAPIDPKPLARGIDQAWQIAGNPNRIIATQRTLDVAWYDYTLILYRAEAS